MSQGTFVSRPFVGIVLCGESLGAWSASCRAPLDGTAAPGPCIEKLVSDATAASPEPPGRLYPVLAVSVSNPPGVGFCDFQRHLPQLPILPAICSACPLGFRLAERAALHQQQLEADIASGELDPE